MHEDVTHSRLALTGIRIRGKKNKEERKFLLERPLA